MAHVGMIGLGLVGTPLAERLMAAGHIVSGFDIDESRCRHLDQLGGISAASAQEVVAKADVCLLSLPTSDVVAQVMGDLVKSLSGKVVIDTTTGAPDATARLSADLAAQGVTYLDATIVGSSQQVRTGDVLVLVGGAETAFRTWHKLFDSFARQTFYLGSAGSGARMKLVVNLVLGLNRAVLAEGLVFARACGVDPARALEVLRAGLSYSRVMDTKGRKMLERDFAVEARLSQHHKDVGLILEVARRADVELPLTQVHDQLLSAAELAGFGAADNSCDYRCIRTIRWQIQ